MQLKELSSNSSANNFPMEHCETVLDFRQHYLSHRDINDYLDSLQAKFPKLVRVKTIGYSFEKRTLKSIHISMSSSSSSSSSKVSELNSVKKSKSASNCIRTKCVKHSSATICPQKIDSNRRKTILIDGGMHGREWCTISTALYCASQLTEHFDANKDLLDVFDFVIVPIVNADGYEYSRHYKKMWRKSRRPILYSKFIGVDCNRNFSVGWDEACQKISSCTYRGEKPFSEPETRIIKYLMHSLKPTFYLTLHSFGKSIMFPYAHTKTLPENWLCLRNLARAGRLAIKKETGSKFRVGSVASLIKNSKSSGGGSMDYAHKTAKIPFVIGMELSGESFQPSNTAINGIICECWVGIRAMCSFLKKQI